MFYTDLKLICKTTEDVQEIENALKKWRYSDILGYSVADNWIGKIPVNAGLTTYEGGV